MAQKTCDVQIPVYLNPRIAEQAFHCEENNYCFLILWDRKDREDEMIFM